MKSKDGKMYVYLIVGCTGNIYGMFKTLKKAKKYINNNDKLNIRRYEVV